MSVASDEHPRRPADAYHVMARILGDQWFLAPHPKSGVEVIVQGPDGVDTRWAMTNAMATALAQRLRGVPGLRWVSHRVYQGGPTDA